jgi:hypothetical protein
MACDWWNSEVEQLRFDQFYDFELAEAPSSFERDLILAAGSHTTAVDSYYEDEFYLYGGERECCTSDVLQNNPTLAELNGPIDDWDVLDVAFADRQHQHSVSAKQSAPSMLGSCPAEGNKHGPEICASTSPLSISDIGSDTVLRTVKTPSSSCTTVTRTVSDDFVTLERKTRNAVSSAEGTKEVCYSPLLLSVKRQLLPNVKSEDVSQSASSFTVSNALHNLEEDSTIASEQPVCKKLKITAKGMHYALSSFVK